MKKTIFAALCAVLLLLLCSCADSYSSDVPVTELSDAVGVFFGDSMVSMADSYLRGAMKLDPDMFAEFSVTVNAAGTSVDEYGIFKARDADSVSAVTDAVKGYLQLRRDNWMPEYMPEERPKLDSAVVETRGLYVIYVIGSDTLCARAVSAFENTLK